MKRILSIVLMIAMLCGTSAFAEKRAIPEDKKLYTTDDVVGQTTTFRSYDKNFYDESSQEPGQVVRLEYNTEQYGDKAVHWANVYLPYGYEEDGATRYPILYFFHGTNETQDSFIGDERVKNAVDNMIEVGVARPFIMVLPTYYYDYENRAIDVERFVLELRQDLMPAVEGAYRTYAETADDAGFRASRMQRAFAGYSRGGRMTWEMFGHMRDYSYWYLPCSGGYSTPEKDPVAEEQLNVLNTVLTDGQQDCFLYVSCGGKRDNAMPMLNILVQGMLDDAEHFSYGLNPGENNLYYCLSTELHQTLIARFYLYNAFCDVLWKD